MAFRVVTNILVVVHSDQQPHEEEVHAYHTLLAKDLPANCRSCLVVTKGGGLTAKQRAKTTEVLKGRGLGNSKVAIVTNVGPIKLIVTGLSWFNPNVKAFPIAALDQALKYLDATPPQSAQVAIEIRKMSRALTGEDMLDAARG